MIKFSPIASSSAGNAFITESNGSKILIECGLNYKEIQKAFNFKTSEIEACLITHEHNDHTHAIKDILRAGIDVYMTEGTREGLGIKHHRIKIVEPLRQFSLGDWTILPFDVEHDAKEPVGYLIQNASGDRLLFATDTYYIRYKFNNLNIIAVECNYSKDILEQNILDGTVPIIMKRRLVRSHFSLENYINFLKANDLRKVREIWLIHMSSNNSDEELFKNTVQKVTGKPVYTA